MTSVTQSLYTNQQIATWLRGLLTVAWADGHYDRQEQELISQVTQDHHWATTTPIGELEQISPDELANYLGGDRKTAENFLRTAVMVALADGDYSSTEADLISSYCQALGLQVNALKSFEQALDRTESDQSLAGVATSQTDMPGQLSAPHSDLLQPLKDWLDEMEIHDPRVARLICKLVPAQCPFERDIKIFGRKIAHIPPLCRINPLYEQLIGLRFRALSYLADECKEDVSAYV